MALTQTDFEFVAFVDQTLACLMACEAMAALTFRAYQPTPASAAATRRSLGAVGLRFGLRRLSADERAWQRAKTEAARWGFAEGGA